MYQSVVDAYVNCEKIGRKITRSVLDLFAYKKKFKPNKVEFRIAQRGYRRDVHSRYLVSLQTARLRLISLQARSSTTVSVYCLVINFGDKFTDEF